MRQLSGGRWRRTELGRAEEFHFDFVRLIKQIRPISALLFARLLNCLLSNVQPARLFLVLQRTNAYIRDNAILAYSIRFLLDNSPFLKPFCFSPSRLNAITCQLVPTISAKSEIYKQEYNGANSQFDNGEKFVNIRREQFFFILFVCAKRASRSNWANWWKSFELQRTIRREFLRSNYKPARLHRALR